MLWLALYHDQLMSYGRNPLQWLIRSLKGPGATWQGLTNTGRNFQWTQPSVTTYAHGRNQGERGPLTAKSSFVLLKAVSQIKHWCSPKVKRFAPKFRAGYATAYTHAITLIQWELSGWLTTGNTILRNVASTNTNTSPPKQWIWCKSMAQAIPNTCLSVVSASVLHQMIIVPFVVPPAATRVKLIARNAGRQVVRSQWQGGSGSAFSKGREVMVVVPGTTKKTIASAACDSIHSKVQFAAFRVYTLLCLVVCSFSIAF